MVRGRKSKHPGDSTGAAMSGHLEDWEQLAVDYVDGHLDTETRAAVQAHLDGCPECASRLDAQQDILALVGQTTLAEPPSDLEAKVLAQLLPVAEPTPAKRLFSRRTTTGRTTTRPRALPAGPWLPAMAGATALVALVLALTLSPNPGALDETMTTVAAVFSSEAGTVETASDGDAVQPGTTAQTLVAGSDATLYPNGTPATTGADGPISVASLQPVGPYLQDEVAMASELSQAKEPAYFFFDAPEGNLVTAEEADTAASLLTSATGLQVMDQSLSADVKAFAAFVPRDDSSAVVHLLCTIGDSIELPVCLSLAPGVSVSTWAESMVGDKHSLAELSASPRVPSGWRYTTSTATPTTLQARLTTRSTVLDEAGTHVLVVIFMPVED